MADVDYQLMPSVDKFAMTSLSELIMLVSVQLLLHFGCVNTASKDNDNNIQLKIH